MTTQLDAQLGISVAESTYNTPVTVTTFYEFTDEDLNWDPTFKTSSGFRVGQVTDFADRRVLVKEESSGSFTVEGRTKGLGKLFQAAMGGTGVSTLISGSAYQQNFVPTTTDYLNSYTIQKAIPPLGGGASLPMTFSGMVCSGFEVTAPNGDIPTIKFNWLGASNTTATALAAASYPAGDGILSFTGASLAIGGTFTAPTTTALASTSGATSVDIREASIKYDNALDSNGWNFGSTGKRSRKPALGKRDISGSITAEWDTAVLRDAFLAQTDLCLILTYAFPTLISGSSFPTLQFAFPDVRLEGELPKANGGDVVTQSIDFTALNNRTNASMYVSIVTAETAI